MHAIDYIYLQKEKDMGTCVIALPWILLKIDIN